jgi:site-specific DNA-methyltransferase (adenine-specific)
MGKIELLSKLPLIQLHHDTNQIISEYRDNQFNISLADPPYGDNNNFHRRNHTRSKLVRSKDYHNALWDQPRPTLEFFNQMFRISESQIVFGANYFGDIYPFLDWELKTPRRHQIKEFMNRNPQGVIIWDKMTGSSTFNDYEIIWTSFEFETFIFKFMWSGMMQGKSISQGHVMNANKKKNEKRIHPTMKPIKLYLFLLKQFGSYACSIIDLYGGSFNSGIAAHQLGMDYTAVEIEKKYFDDGFQNIKSYLSQENLFKRSFT